MAGFYVHEDGRTLQQLTPAQVAARLAAYAADGTFERDLHQLWQDAGDLIAAAVSEHFGDEAVALVRAHYTSPVDADWIQAVAHYGIRLYARRQSVPAYMVARARLTIVW